MNGNFEQSDNTTRIALLEQEFQQLKSDVIDIKIDTKATRNDVHDLSVEFSKFSSRWAGGIVVIITIGAIIGWIIATTNGVMSFLNSIKGNLP